MNIKEHFIDPLIEKAENYGKTSFELLKLKSLDKTADVASSIISRFIAVLILFLFILTLNTGIALWLGDLLGKSYYGFLALASFYALIGIIVLVIHSFIKARIKNSIVNQLLN